MHGLYLLFSSLSQGYSRLFLHLVIARAQTNPSPFTDMIYSAAHKKSQSKRSVSASGSTSTSEKSTATSTATSKPAGSAPTTPRKSSRTKAGEISYADAAAEEPASDNEVVEVKPTINKTPKTAATPRRSGRVSTVTREELAGGASPMRMTRSRSKGRGLGGSETDD